MSQARVLHAGIASQPLDHHLVMITLDTKDSAQKNSEKISAAIAERVVPICGLTVKMAETSEGKEARPSSLACLHGRVLPDLLHLRLIGLRLGQVPFDLKRLSDKMLTLNL